MLNDVPSPEQVRIIATGCIADIETILSEFYLPNHTNWERLRGELSKRLWPGNGFEVPISVIEIIYHEQPLEPLEKLGVPINRFDHIGAALLLRIDAEEIIGPTIRELFEAP